MFLLMEMFIFLSTILPIFHLLNAILNRTRQNEYNDCAQKKMFSILIPCFNEEDTVGISVDGLLAMNYKNYEALYINDGSDDRTLAALDQALELKKIPTPFRAQEIKSVYQSQKHRNFYVLDKGKSGKSAALNLGISYARAALVVTLDADSILKGDALERMNCAFEDQKLVAAGGSIHIIQGYNPSYLSSRLKLISRMIVTLQILEYLKGFYI